MNRTRTTTTPKVTIRRAQDRGHAAHGWLDTFHTFSFADYHDPAHDSFRALRVLNDDWIAAGRGFGAHPHRDMEILTYVLEGALEHKDSLGTGAVMRAGDVQRMSAGTGVVHSEANPSPTEALHLLQIWLFPERRNLPPEYEQKTFTREEKLGRLRLIASRDGRDGSLSIHQDVSVFATVLPAGQAVSHELAAGRHAWVQVARGRLSLNGEALETGDGASLSGKALLELRATEEAELLLFDLA